MPKGPVTIPGRATSAQAVVRLFKDNPNIQVWVFSFYLNHLFSIGQGQPAFIFDVKHRPVFSSNFPVGPILATLGRRGVYKCLRFILCLDRLLRGQAKAKPNLGNGSHPYLPGKERSSASSATMRKMVIPILDRAPRRAYLYIFPAYPPVTNHTIVNSVLSHFAPIYDVRLATGCKSLPPRTTARIALVLPQPC